MLAPSNDIGFSETILQNQWKLEEETWQTGAIFSEDRKYRFALWRIWTNAPKVLFIMLNPSIANESIDDPTQIRCRNFAKKLGFGGYYVANLFALVSTDPKGLKKEKDPIGLFHTSKEGFNNNEHLEKLHRESTCTILAWGCWNKSIHERAKAVLSNLGNSKSLYCLAMSKDGCPRHPLYLKGDLTPTRFLRVFS